MNQGKGYTYENAGFNGFMRRTIASDPGSTTLSQMKRSSLSSNNLNFDNLQVSGNLGDTIEVGRILIDGASGNGRLNGRDENTNTVWRVGDLEEV